MKIYIAGHTGLVGSALVRHFSRDGRASLLTAARAELDLKDGQAVRSFLEVQRPDIVIVAAGRVGGILANTRSPAEFLYDNLMIQANLIHGAWAAGVKRLLNFGSSCIYPKHCPQPMQPEHLLTGALESTSEPYAIAKLAGLALCDSYTRQYGLQFMTAIPCTLYGPHDNFDPAEAHVLSALIRKFHDARRDGLEEVPLWGSGQVRREFLYVDDFAEACEVLVQADAGPAPINVGSGQSQTIREVAALVADVVGFRGTLSWDASRPDGAPEKLLDSRPIQRLGWRPRTPLRAGVEQTYRWFLEHTLQHPTEVSACGSS
jgi:GDP-L-fucose synthase